MLRHRLSKIGKASLLALFALLVGGMFNSCQDQFDEYAYDDGDQPSWLGESVYAFLRNNTSGHTYNYYADIIDDLDETETFNKTGSKTVFVADDAAFDRFFASDNSWGVHSYDELTVTQKKILLKASMLDDAMLLDMLSFTTADEASEGTCMRRLTSLSALDSIPLVTKDQMPEFNRYWKALYNSGKIDDDSLLIAKDSSDPMMVHFLPFFLKRNGITPDDISFLFRGKNGEEGKTYKQGEVFIYDKKILASGVKNEGFSDDTTTITCKNGYLYRLDDVLVPPSNMAEEMRKREDLSVLSRLFDRFCLPVYDKNLSDRYYSVTGKNDSVFSLRYYVKKNGGIGSLKIDNEILENVSDRPKNDEYALVFDPGANQYTSPDKTLQADMGAILAPTNDAILEYFTTGAGSVVVSTHASSVNITDIESLNKALDLVPDNLIAIILNNLMQTSFTNSVYSRFDRITDEVGDRIDGVENAVTECIVANNGIIYVVNKVFDPAKYAAVSFPLSLLNNMILTQQVVEQLGYGSFLLAKIKKEEEKYTLFMPDDKAFLYYDPATTVRSREVGGNAHLHEIHFDANHNIKQYSGDTVMYRKIYNFTINDAGEYVVDHDSVVVPSTALDVIDFNTITKNYTNNAGDMTLPSTLPLTGYLGFNSFMYNRMNDLVENLIVIGDITSGNKYYLTKGGNAVKVDASDISNIKIQGGEQVDNGDFIAVKQSFTQQANGKSYNTIPAGGEESWVSKKTGVPTPTTKSLYRNLYAKPGDAKAPFYEFMKLAYPDIYVQDGGIKITDVLGNLYKGLSDEALKDSAKAYSLFYDNRPMSYNGVPLFKGYNYTVYVPSNDAVKDIVAKGLPTWVEINECAKGANGGTVEQAIGYMKMLNNLFRYHIQDNSVFVDNIAYAAPKSYETANINSNGLYEEVEINMTGGELIITDVCGNEARVMSDDAAEENKTWNVLCRDIEFKANKNDPSATPTGIISSSASVAHRIDKVLIYSGLMGYDGLVKRFAPDGETVDTLLVAGKDGLYEAEDGKKYYLIATNTKTINASGKRYTVAGYLMERKSTSEATKLSREKYVLDADGEKILITTEGYRVLENDGVYELAQEVENGNIYLQKYDNNGKSYEKVLLAPAQ